MSNLSESVQLLGLIVNTVPFEVVENNVVAEISINVDLEQLESMKSSLEAEKEAHSESSDDNYLVSMSDDIYFLTKVIENIKEKVNGDNIQ